MPPAFIVDGLTEKKIVQRLCEGATVRMTQLNGRDVALEAIAKAACSLINLFRGRHYPIIIIVDREGRNLSSQQIEHELTELLKLSGVPEDQLIVSCPDRMIENWMLGDPDFFKTRYEIALPQNFEGTNGKLEIRRSLSTKNVSYNETTIGVEIFTKLDPRKISETTLSFARFKHRAESFCAWLRR